MQPIAVIDTRDHHQHGRLLFSGWYLTWMADNGIGDHYAYRAEILAEGDGQIKLYCFARDETGKVLSHKHNPLTTAPIFLPLKSMPAGLVGEHPIELFCDPLPCDLPAPGRDEPSPEGDLPCRTSPSAATT